MGRFFFAALLMVSAGGVQAADPPGRTRVTGAMLAAAGRNATLEDIDYGQTHCDAGTRLEDWLRSLTGHDARSIKWTGGKCQLVNNMHPGLDAASWPWCAQAEITLAKPKVRDDKPLIEIFLHAPEHGRAGGAYAFRSEMMTREDGADHLRFRLDFELEWRDRFPPADGGTRCED